MASLFADENFPLQVVEALRQMGHDVLTAREAGQSNRGTPDREILVLAASFGRVLLTLNRWDFVRLHTQDANHAGIVAYSQDPAAEGQARRIHSVVTGSGNLMGKLIRIDRPAP